MGLNIWEVDDSADLRRRFAPAPGLLRDLIEVTPVVTAPEARQLLLGGRPEPLS